MGTELRNKGYKPDVSVIIDTYNYGRFIDQAIDSVLQQTLPERRREIIVVDDGSTDDTPERVAKYSGQIQYIRKNNGGQASAFNAGVNAAQGPIVCFLDSDDFYYPTKLAAVVKKFSQDPSVGVVYDRYDIVDEANSILAKDMPPKLYTGDLEGRTLLGYVTGSPSSGISIRRERLSSISIPEEPFRISADYFYLNILPLTTKVGTIMEALHAYRLHDRNMYLAQTRVTQQKIHPRQRETIWAYAADNFGKRFVRGVHTYSWLGERALGQ